jgi:hypothetical protein
MRSKLIFALFLTLVALSFTSDTQAAPTFIQACSAASNGAGNASCTLAGVGQHHKLVLAVYSCGAIALSFTAPDTFGLTYYGINGGGAYNTGPLGCNFRIRWVNIFSADSGLNSGNDTITINADGAITLTNSIIFAEYSNTKAYDGVNSGIAIGGNEPGPLTITTSNLPTNLSGDLLTSAGESSCAALPGVLCTANAMTAGAGYTVRACIANTNDGNGAGFISQFCFEDKVAGAAGNYAGSLVQSQNALWGWEIVLGAFGAQSALGSGHRRSQIY